MYVLPALDSERVTTPNQEAFDETKNPTQQRERRNPNVCAGVTKTCRAQNSLSGTFDETHNAQRQLTGNVLRTVTPNLLKKLNQ